MKRKRVAVVHPYFAHYREGIVSELANRGSHYYVFAGDGRDPTHPGTRLCRFDDTSRMVHAPSRLLPGNILVQWGLIRLALSPGLDAIIFFGDAHFVSTWISAGLARMCGKRVLFWSHGWLKPERGLKSWIRCTFYRLGHGMLLYGERAKELGMEKGFKSDDLYVVYNSMDKQKQEEIRSRITTHDLQKERTRLFGHCNRPVVVCCCRFVAEKRIELLLEAAILLQKSGNPIDVLLVGDGPQQSQLETMAKTNGLSVFFEGACYEEERLALLFMLANVTVVPGTIGLTAIHSLTYGTPVITHDDVDDQGPEWEAIKSGINGEVFRKGDPVDLARVITQWANKGLPGEAMRSRCIRSIDQLYNPSYQVQVFDASVEGVPAGQIQSANSSRTRIRLHPSQAPHRAR